MRKALRVCIVVSLVLMSFVLITGLGTTSEVGAANYPGFRVVGRHLYDRFGEKVVLYGPNKMIYWMDVDGVPSYAEMEKTGANVVRIQWLMDGTAAQLDTAITNCINNHMIPMIELHDRTCGAFDVQPLVDYWTRSDIVSVIQKHEEYLLVNIGNEVGTNVSDSEFRSTYRSAVNQMRSAGIHVPLIIDADGCGKDIDTIQANGPYLIDEDPDHNLMFSVHMWWPYAWGYTDQTVRDEIHESVNMGLPLIIGEFGNKWDDSAGGDIPYQTIIQEAYDHQVGYLPWSWGPGNSPQTHLDMTTDSHYDTLHGWGLEVAVTSQYSIQNIAQRPAWLEGGPTPTPGDTPTPEPTATPTSEPDATDTPTPESTATPTPTGDTVTVNDSVTGTGLNEFEYVGNWSVGTGADKYEGDDHYSSTTDDYFQVRFDGTQIALYGAQAAWHGIAAVSIDGGPETEVDYYSSTRQDDVLLWTSDTLAAGEHTLKVRVTGTHNASSSGNTVTADRVVITTGGTTDPTPTPTPEATDTPTPTPEPTDTPSPTPESGTEEVVYDDATTWDNWSWDTSVDFNNTSPAYAGSKSMALTYNAGWAGLQLHRPSALDTSDYDRITFWAHGGSSGTRQIKVFTYNSSGSQSSSVQVDVPAGQWAEVTVYLSDLGNPSNISRICLQDRTGGSQPTFYVDDLKVVGP